MLIDGVLLLRHAIARVHAIDRWGHCRCCRPTQKWSIDSNAVDAAVMSQGCCSSINGALSVRSVDVTRQECCRSMGGLSLRCTDAKVLSINSDTVNAPVMSQGCCQSIGVLSVRRS